MSKEFQHINFRIEERVARITFARPPLNVFDIAMMREMSDALNECLPQRDLAAIVFDAAPETRAFSAGVAVEEHVPETVYQMLDAFHSVFRLLAQISRPVIAVVDGPALGGGWMAPEVIFKVDGQIRTTEEYSEMRANPPLDGRLFDPQYWTSVHWRE